MKKKVRASGRGGLDEGEEPENAWKRELMEEIHVSAEDVELLGSYPEWLAYELPKEVRSKPDVQAKQGRGRFKNGFSLGSRMGRR